MPLTRSTTKGHGKRRKSKPRPSATQRARAQEQQYASQGKAVEKQANRQRKAARTQERPSRRPTAFRPLPKRTAPFKVQRQQAKRRHERARRDLPDHPAIPHIPTKKRYTKRETTAIRRIYKRAARKEGVPGINQLYELGSKRQREQMRAVSERVRRSEEPARRREVARRPSLVEPLKPSPGRRKTLGLIPTASIEARTMIPGVTRGTSAVKAGSNLRPLVFPFEAGANVAIATAEDPGAVAKSSLRTARESVAGFFHGVKMTVDAGEAALHGDLDKAKDLLGQIAQDYENRYGTAVEGDWEAFRKAIKEDYGITPYALDAAALAGVGGQAGGTVARSATFGQLAKLPGKPGTVARAIHEATKETNERPRRRFSAGEEGTRAQRVSKNLLVAGVQRQRDRRSAVRYTKAVRRAGYEELPSGEMRRVRRDAAPDRLPGLRPGPGEVVRRSARDVGPWKGLTGRVARDIGGVKSTARLQMLTHRGRVMQEVNKTVDKLDDREQAGLALALKYGVNASPGSLQVLRARLDEIEGPDATEARRGAGLEAESMEAEAIRAVLEDPEAYLTPEVQGAAATLREVQKREAANDPGLADDQELIRRVSQQAAVLGVPRALGELAEG
jgi:hypothetical protein